MGTFFLFQYGDSVNRFISPQEDTYMQTHTHTPTLSPSMASENSCGLDLILVTDGQMVVVVCVCMREQLGARGKTCIQQAAGAVSRHLFEPRPPAPPPPLRPLLLPRILDMWGREREKGVRQM